MRGALKGVEGFPDGLSAKEFRVMFSETVAVFLNRPLAEVLTVIGDISDSDTPTGPIGLVTIEYADRVAIPHVYWFPWATARQRIEAGVKFFISLKRDHVVLITTREERDVKYFHHLCKYGLLRPVGKIWDWYEDGVGAMVFQSVGN